MEWTVRTSAAGARLGVWRAPISRSVVETPALALPTSKGFVPHLTACILTQHVGSSLVLQVALEDVLEAPVASTPSSERGALATFCAWPPGTSVLLTSRNAVAPFEGPRTTAARAVVRTRTGHAAVTPARFTQVCQALHVDLACCPTNYVARDAGTKAYDKTVNGTLSLLGAVLQEAPPALASRLAGAVHVGGARDAMRAWSCEQTARHALGAYELCGVDQLEDGEQRARLVAQCVALLPDAAMRVTQGCFSPSVAVALVRAGVDVVCSSFATDCASQGKALTFVQSADGSIAEDSCLDLTHDTFTLDRAPIEASCECYTCATTTRAYVHHLLATHEMLGNTLLAIHNLHRFLGLFARLRSCFTNK